ncbi:hypothetical protein OBO34_19665 [Clostridiales Family XIII bacterium ASD5510]|uniref:Uncharacterized protein n=1 Tax=Hominibacterium faecale TaxID=2839743 RepID=A0A9J6QYK6_9FIRM|nr:hypothetical protein [Hominibacterium faecale]MCU7380533.1 hypothetical protein [Hominibacterium faecale]
MSETIITSLITAGALILVQIIISRKQQRIQDVKNEYVIKEVQDDIKRLENKQDKHNSLIERMVVVERDLKTAWKNIDELKEREDRK